MATRRWDDVSGGWDLREGPVSDRRNVLRVSENVRFVTNGKRAYPVRRDPCEHSDTPSSWALTKGLVELDGKLMTIGSPAVSVDTTTLTMQESGDLIEVQILKWSHDPWGQTDATPAEWELAQVETINDTVCALIKHTGGEPATWSLHVFDGQDMTRCLDASCPVNVHGDEDKPIVYDASWTPVMGVAGGRLWMSRPDGRVAWCGMGRPRVWNTLGVTDLQAEGRRWAVVARTDGTATTLLAPVAPDDLEFHFHSTGALFADYWSYRYYARICEYFDADAGVWRLLREYNDAADLGAADGWYLDATSSETRVAVHAQKAGFTGYYRFRAVPDSPTTWDGAPSFTHVEGDDTVTFDPASPVHHLIEPSTSGDAVSLGPWTVLVWAEIEHLFATEEPWNPVDKYDPSGIPQPDGFSIHFEEADDINIRQPIGSLAWIYPLVPFRLTDNGDSYDRADLEQDTTWYNKFTTDAVENWAGKDDAGWLDPGALASYGPRVTAISSIKNRVAFHYANGTVLFALGAVASTTSLLDHQPVGALLQSPVVRVADRVLVATPTTIRAWSLSGLDSDSMRDNDVGNRIEALGTIAPTAAAWWPHRGCAVFAYVDGSQTRFLSLTLARKDRGWFAAWAQWTIADDGAPPVDPSSMVSVGSWLYHRRGPSLWRFNGQAEVMRDSVDDDDAPYVSAVEWYSDRMDGGIAYLIDLQVTMHGSGRFLVRPTPRRPARLLARPTYTMSHGGPRYPLAGAYQAPAFRWESDDATGWALHEWALEWRSGRR